MRQQPASTRTAYAMLAVVVVAWGFMWTVNKLLLGHLTPLWATASRTIAGAAVLLVIALCMRRLVWPVKGDLPAILSVSLLHMGAFAILANIGLQYVPAGRSVVLAYTTPLWVVPAARVFLNERITRLRLAGLVVGLGGLMTIFNPASFDWQDKQAMFGNTLILLGSMCWAANIVYIRSHKWITPPFELTVWQALLASVLLTLIAFAWEGTPHIIWTFELAGLLTYAGVIGTAIAYWAMVTVNRALPAAATSLGLLAVPVVGLVISTIVLREPLDPALMTGTALIVAGIMLGNARPPERRLRS